MINCQIRSTWLCTVAAALSLIATSAIAALQPRDLNGDAVVDAFYDPDLDITWLRDANVNGLMDWVTAVNWAQNFSFGGFSDWRLPISDTCVGFYCTNSEMGHLWSVELGNVAGGLMTNAGDFQNLSLQSGGFWSGTEVAGNTNNAWIFYHFYGNQYINNKVSGLQAMAVRSGDIPAVPEPKAVLLMLSGLAALAMSGIKRRQYLPRRVVRTYSK